MAEIFLSYSREDLERVKPLVSALEAEGYSVWWDRDLLPGESFEETIDREIQQADCVVAVWSENSIESQWVKNEALEGMDRHVLVPIMLDDVRLPVAFKQAQTADFTDWPSTVSDEEYRKFIHVIEEKLHPGEITNDLELKGIQKMGARGAKRFRRKRDRLFPAAVFLLFLALILSITFKNMPSPEGTSANPRLTIVPFSPGTGDEAEFYANSLTGEIEQRLALFRELELIQVGSVWDLDLVSMSQAVMREESDYLLTGLVSTSADQVTIESRLKDIATDQVIWQVSITENADNLFELQKKLVLGVLSQLNLAASDETDVIKLKALTENKAAYRDYLRGLDLIRRGEQHHILDAIGKLESAVARDPTFSVAYAAICRAYLERYRISNSPQEFEMGKQNCETALGLNDDQALVQLALAELYRASGEPDLAIYRYSRALELDARSADATLGLAAVYFEQGDTLASEELYLRATRLKPTYWKAHNQLGSFYFRQGLYYQAMESYLRVTQLTTANATAHNNLGAARYYAGDFDGAYEAWNASTKLSTSSASYSNMGTALYLLERFDEALFLFETAVKMDPGDHRLWGNVGDNLRFIANDPARVRSTYAKAIELAEKNLSVNPRSFRDSSRLAVYYAALGDEKSALDNIAKSEKFAGDDFNVLYDLAVAYSVLGDQASTTEYITRALDAGYPEVLFNSDPEFNEQEYRRD